MSSTNRSAVRAGKTVAALALLLMLAAPLSARAADPSSLWFLGTRLILERADTVNGEPAVSVRDQGLARFLARLGATIAWQPGQNYIVVTAQDRRIISFTLGDARYTGGGLTARAAFAPYLAGGDAFVPFFTLARALYVEPVKTDTDIVLQPQVGALDVRHDGKRTVVTLHAAAPIKLKRVSETGERLIVALPGFASTLAQTRRIAAPGLGEVDVLVSGPVRNPLTTVTFDAPAGAMHAIVPTENASELVVVFAPAGVALAAPEPSTAPVVIRGPRPPPLSAHPPAPPPPPLLGPTPSPAVTPLANQEPIASAAAAALVNEVTTSPLDDGLSVRIVVNGNASYEWHRLPDPDNRWYVDIRGASLTFGPRDETPGVAAVKSLRVRQLAKEPVAIVRVALTLNGPKRVDVVPYETGLTLIVAGTESFDTARTGGGRIGSGAIAAATPTAQPSDWKFTPGPTTTVGPPTNPRLIVIDPGHGGSDTGAAANGIVEKDVALDISQRLRALLVARGWIVKMTRERDSDVFAPNADGKSELQARCDVANSAGARMFVSIHVNSSTSSSPSGTTTYYYKPKDVGFSNVVHRRLMAQIATNDFGVRKEKFWVLNHTTMPAVLVETAFLSNPGDNALLHSAAFLQKVAAGIADGVTEYAGAPGLSSRVQGER